MKRKLVAVVTNQATYGEDRRHATGLWLSELVHFYDGVTAAGWEVDVISPSGGAVPLDPRSLGRWSRDGATRRFQDDPARMAKLRDTPTAADVTAAEYAGIFYAGGHGVMWDFPDDVPLQLLARTVYEQGGVVSSVCHGACGLLNITLSDGTHLVEGRTVTGFATIEEDVARVKDRVPFLLEDELRKRGAHYVRSRVPMTPYAVSDGRLVTGQNPYSGKAVTRRILDALSLPGSTTAG
ncbi:type 1 glutamine amidotransferase domain-containing protein [Streptomyces sp. WAC06614]|uniref:type 1 glutamine amidotransferase domain-containing protein n=1 Tax=Streptomyces sp. WAC06614 TaxID=2487416 RepID=UPI000F767C6F|nr:type 1 glutamine amidotransferase domain-containing protein [Streptomyces sp. WAC06614]RSS81850.1 type 1 glutamine amidotransferase domain-containing protein [Streptomyces sp. WAC06614]